MEDEKAILARMESWCSRQERCTYEVRTKMGRYGSSERIIESVLQSLKENKYLDDERFATAYAEGKSRIKRWGPRKIAAGLRMKRIPPDLIEEALSSLNKEELHGTMDSLIEAKWPLVRAKDDYEKRAKTLRYLCAKGYGYAEAKASLDRFLNRLDE